MPTSGGEVPGIRDEKPARARPVQGDLDLGAGDNAQPLVREAVDSIRLVAPSTGVSSIGSPPWMHSMSNRQGLRHALTSFDAAGVVLRLQMIIHMGVRKRDDRSQLSASLLPDSDLAPPTKTEGPAGIG
ncbi:hypothetical protein, partial [Microbacterium sp. NPDC057650]|uniref:hypothetical protein n=1 Tax=Microbacterium sp. NPDC057650 TaxID=3346193 RepID=UPI0036729E3A